MRIRMFAAVPVFLLAAVLLNGCAGVFQQSGTAAEQSSLGKIQGSVYGGQQPISGSHVYLFSANTTGYGAASVSLLNAGSTGLSDSVGAYVLTDANGGFSLTNDYTCTTGQQVYMLSLGGDAGSGANAGAALMAILGACPAAGNLYSLPFIFINEATTVAAAYSFAGFAVDATHVADDESVGGNTTAAAAKTGMANAFANAANLVSTFSGGNALAATPAGNGTVPQQELNTLANILAACVNSNGVVSGPSTPTPCYTLFNNATNGASIPTETATAAINIAHHPAANVAALYGLQSAISPFGNKLSNQPNDFTVALMYTGGGLSNQQQLAIDGKGNAWITDLVPAAVSEFSPLGAALSPAAGFTGGMDHPQGLAFDPATGNAWVASTYNNSLVVLSGSTGASLASYSNGGVSAPYQVKFDVSGNVWAVNNYQSNAVTKMDTSGNSLSGTSGYAIGDYQPKALVIDGSSNVFVLNSSNVIKVSNAGSVLATYAYPTNGNAPFDIALDASNNVWMCTYGSYLTELSNTGVSLSGSGFTGGGLNYAYSLAFDGANNIWVANRSNDISEFTSAGVAVSPSTGYTSGFLNAPYYIAIDGSGNVWTANGYASDRVVELIGAAAPVVVPLGLATATGKIAARP